MIGKAVLLLVVATVAVQSYVPYEADQQVDVYNAYGGSLIDNLKKLIEKAIASAKAALDKIFKDLFAKIKQIVDKAIDAFNKDFAELREKIKKIIQEAEKVKVDITECLKDNEEELNRLPKEYAEEVAQCSDGIINKGKEAADKSKKSVEETVQIVKNLADEFKACGDRGVHAFKCKAQVSIKIAKAIVEVPAKIKKIVIEALPVIINLVPEAQKCVSKQTENYAVKGQAIVKKIERCVDAKIHPTTKA